MDALEFVTQLLAPQGITVRRPRHDFIDFPLLLSGKQRTVVIHFDERSQIQLLIFLGTATLGKRAMRRIRAHLHNDHINGKVTGHLVRYEDLLYWEITTLVSANSEATGEIFFDLLAYTAEDLQRVDIVFGTVQNGQSRGNTLRMLGTFGHIEGTA